MYKAVVFFFSGTGNTWWVADGIKKQLDARNINADTVSIDSVDSKKADWWIKTADLVFFGWPVYGSDLPEPMKKFIDSLPVNKKGKHVHTFCTQMMFSGDGAWLYHKHFKEKGLYIDSAEHFIMPSNMSNYRGPLSTPNEKKIEKIMERCAKHIEIYVEELLIGNTRIQGKYSYLLGIMQRAPYRLFYSRFQNAPGVETTRCTKCGLCADSCPMGNIKMNDYPEFLNKCALCFRCYSFCPESAITIYGKTRDLEKLGKPYLVHDKRIKISMLK